MNFFVSMKICYHSKQMEDVDAYLEPSRTSLMELFLRTDESLIVSGFYRLDSRF